MIRRVIGVRRISSWTFNDAGGSFASVSRGVRRYDLFFCSMNANGYISALVLMYKPSIRSLAISEQFKSLLGTR